MEVDKRIAEARQTLQKNLELSATLSVDEADKALVAADSQAYAAYAEGVLREASGTGQGEFRSSPAS